MSKRLHNNEGIYNSNYIQSLERKYCCSSAVLASSGCVVSSGGLGGRVALRIYEGGRRLMYTAAVGAMLLNNMAPAAMADTTVVSAGDISAGLGAGEGSDILVYGTTSNTALSGGRETVYSGGLTVSTVVSPGEQIVSSGGVANYTTVNDLGVQYIYSGGEANYTTINDGGYQYISSGGEANSTTINTSGFQNIYSGGVANSTTIDRGAQHIYGGEANSTTLYGDAQQVVSSGGVANSTTLYGEAYQVVYSGGVANSTTIDDEAYQGIGAGEANYTTINRGTQDIVLGGVANYTTINNGVQFISSGGVANSTTIEYYGNQHIFSGGVANYTTINNGVQFISSGGVANSTTVNDFGVQYIYSGGEANSTTLYGFAQQLVSSGGVANSTTIDYYGNQHIFSGGEANSTMINSGNQYISSGGVANSTTINDGGYQYISSGGVANSTTVNSFGYQYIYSGGIANDTYLKSNGNLILIGGSANNTVVSSGGVQFISSGGEANDTVVNSGGRQSIYSGGSANDTIVSNGGYQTVYTGGVANSTKIYSKGNQVISSGGVANDTIVSSGGIQNIYSGGSANDTVVKALGYQIVSSGGSANSSIINERGRQNISSGGVANDTVVNTYGYQYVYDGVANDTVVNELGFQMVFSGGSANNAIVSSGGIQNIYFGGVANGTTLNGGEQYVSRGVANDTVVNTSGIQVVYSGGSANNTIVSSGGRQNIYFGGMANNTHIKPNGELILRGGVANALQAEGGLISVIDTSYLSGYTNMINGTQIVFAESTPDAKLSMENLDANQLNIKMNVNLEEQTGNVLYIEQGFRGNAEIELNNTAASAAPTEGEGIRLVDFGSSGYMEEGAIYLKGGQWDDGGYIYNLFQGGMSSAGMDYDYYLRSTGKYSDLFKTMLNIPLMNVMIARTGMNSLQTRLGDLRDMDNQGKKHGIWVRSYYKDLTVNDLTETDMNLFGVEAGYDWLFRADEPTKLYAGVMLGYIKANDIKTAKENGGYDTGDGESPSVGVYATLVDDSRWFVDIAARNFWTKLDMTNYSAAGNILSYEPKRNVIAASVEGGKSFLSPVKGGGFFKIEPKVELTYMRASSDSASVQGGMGDLSYDAGDYLNAKAAVLFGYTIKRGNGLLIEPLVELAYRYEFLGKNDVYYGGAQKESDIGGSVGEANIGLNMQLTKDLYWYALGGYEYGSHIKGWSANLGIRLAFGGEKAKEEPQQALAPEQGQTSEQPPVEQQDSPTRFIRIR